MSHPSRRDAERDMPKPVNPRRPSRPRRMPDPPDGEPRSRPDPMDSRRPPRPARRPAEPREQPGYDRAEPSMGRRGTATVTRASVTRAVPPRPSYGGPPKGRPLMSLASVPSPSVKKRRTP